MIKYFAVTSKCCQTISAKLKERGSLLRSLAKLVGLFTDLKFSMARSNQTDSLWFKLVAMSCKNTMVVAL